MKPGSGKKVLLAMSGGVDSSVAAVLLKEQGYDVVGCFMRLGSESEPEFDNLACKTDSSAASAPKAHHQGCCSLNDASDARHVAALLDVPFYVLNFKKDFGRIIDYFVDEYNAGRTPNPCVRCNDWLKFGKLHSYAQSIGAHFTASGHYARIDHSTGRARLLRGRDHNKDQSYVLFGAPRERLDHMLLPVGELTKPEVRQIAQDHNLPVFNKPDSQEICFVPDNDYARLVKKRTPDQVTPGEILDTAGNTVGQHPGHQHFTIGQRRGLGVALGYPIYVTHRDPQGNTITVGQKQDLLTDHLTANQTNWLIDSPPTDWTSCEAKIRYNAEPVPAEVRRTADDELQVRFPSPQESITPGQAVVCYQNDQVIAGGWIR